MSELHSSPCVLNSFLSEFPKLVVSRGGNAQMLCESVGLSLQDVTGLNQMIPFERFVALLEASATQLHTDDFAFLLAAHQDLRAFGPVSLMLGTCSTVGDAVSVFVNHLNLLASGISIQINPQGDSLTLLISVHVPELKHRRQFRDYLVGSTLMAVKILCDGAVQLKACQLYGQPQTTAERVATAKHLDCEPVYGADQVILSFPASLNQLPLNRQAIPATLSTINIADARGQFEQKIESALCYLLIEGCPSITKVTSLLGCSERTLRRRLTENALSYSGILDGVRLQHANRYLKSTHYRIGDIATLLGYANQSAFTRSYIRLTGSSPREFRAGLKLDTRKL